MYIHIFLIENFQNQIFENFFNGKTWIFCGENFSKILTRWRSTRIRIWCVSTASWPTRNLFKNALVQWHVYKYMNLSQVDQNKNVQTWTGIPRLFCPIRFLTVTYHHGRKLPRNLHHFPFFKNSISQKITKMCRFFRFKMAHLTVVDFFAIF